jgi:hypothetical protein
VEIRQEVDVGSGGHEGKEGGREGGREGRTIHEPRTPLVSDGLGPLLELVGGEGGREGGKGRTIHEPRTPLVSDGLGPLLELVGGEDLEEGLLGPLPVDHEGADRAPAGREGEGEGGREGGR